MNLICVYVLVAMKKKYRLRCTGKISLLNNECRPSFSELCERVRLSYSRFQLVLIFEVRINDAMRCG